MVKKVTKLPVPIVHVGSSVFIRTVTSFFTGTIVEISGDYLRLSNAAWIADTGRFSDFLKTGLANEVEPYHDDVCVYKSGIVDLGLWPHALPRVQK